MEEQSSRESNGPCRRTDLVRQAAGPDTLLYDPVADAVHVLNPTAVAVWELCDGRHTSADIEAALCTRFDVSEQQDLAADVRTALDHLEAAGLLKSGDACP